MKKVGQFKGVDFYEDPNCPPGMIYMLNEDNHFEFSIDNRSKWQRFKDWIKEIVRKYRV